MEAAPAAPHLMGLARSSTFGVMQQPSFRAHLTSYQFSALRANPLPLYAGFFRAAGPALPFMSEGSRPATAFGRGWLVPCPIEGQPPTIQASH
jgi:hypothetical protein